MGSILIVGCRGQLGTGCMKVMPTAIGIDVPEIDLSDRESCFDRLDEVSPNVIINIIESFLFIYTLKYVILYAKAFNKQKMNLLC